jgi:hypothetical protein
MSAPIRLKSYRLEEINSMVFTRYKVIDRMTGELLGLVTRYCKGTWGSSDKYRRTLFPDGIGQTGRHHISRSRAVERVLREHS